MNKSDQPADGILNEVDPFSLNEDEWGGHRIPEEGMHILRVDHRHGIIILMHGTKILPHQLIQD